MALLVSLSAIILQAQQVPKVYSGITKDGKKYNLKLADEVISEYIMPPRYSLSGMVGNPKGTDQGIVFDFGSNFHGKLFYGLVPYGDSKHPMPVYFRQELPIESGSVEVNIRGTLRGRYDMVDWFAKKKGTIGYRINDWEGNIIYDGLVSFKGNGPFEIDCTVIEGPFVNLLQPHGATFSFKTNQPVAAKITVGERDYGDGVPAMNHEIVVSGLYPDSLYDYSLEYCENRLDFTFRTAPLPGTRKPFVFAYASDSRTGQGGGERSMYGVNTYVFKKIMALARFHDVRFMQFSGDLISGYLSNVEDTQLQYANWKRVIQPFAHYFPVYVGMGNHEVILRTFIDTVARHLYQVDRFPFSTESSEAIFAENFTLPQNGPESEDNMYYDPDTSQVDFPSYSENVYYYTYDNIAVIVLNSDYFYAPTSTFVRRTGGCLHGYVMDNQLNWLKETVDMLEKVDDIDHIFMTIHTPCFPNGGHTMDDMWYGGNNGWRPYVAGKPLHKGIIERRDEILNILVNESEKVRAILTGDEHNYNRLHLHPETKIYPDNYFAPKIKLRKPIFQINNGAAGAPYYAQEQMPWTPYVSNFTTQHAVVFFNVDGKQIWVEVRNPDTLELVDQFWLVE